MENSEVKSDSLPEMGAKVTIHTTDSPYDTIVALQEQVTRLETVLKDVIEFSASKDRPERFESSYAIFVWMRQVNERLGKLERKETTGAVEQRAEFEGLVESFRDKLQAQIDLHEDRISTAESVLLSGTDGSIVEGEDNAKE